MTIVRSPLLPLPLLCFVRQEISKRHYNPLIVFCHLTAFVASLISGMSLKYSLGNDPHIALASSVFITRSRIPIN